MSQGYWGQYQSLLSQPLRLALLEVQQILLFQLTARLLVIQSPKPPKTSPSPLSDPLLTKVIDPLTHRLIMQKLNQDRLWHQRKRSDEIEKNVFAQRIARIEEEQRMHQLQLMQRQEHRRRSQLGLISLQEQAENRLREISLSNERVKQLRQKESVHQRILKRYSQELRAEQQRAQLSLQPRVQLLRPMDHSQIKRHGWFYDQLKRKYQREHDEIVIRQQDEFQYHKPNVKLRIAVLLEEERRKEQERLQDNHRLPKLRLQKIKEYGQLIKRKRESTVHDVRYSLPAKTQRTQRTQLNQGQSRSQGLAKDYLHQYSSEQLQRAGENRIQRLARECKAERHSVDSLLYQLGRMDEDIRKQESLARVRGKDGDQVDGVLFKNITAKIKALRGIAD